MEISLKNTKIRNFILWVLLLGINSANANLFSESIKFLDKIGGSISKYFVKDQGLIKSSSIKVVPSSVAPVGIAPALKPNLVDAFKKLPFIPGMDKSTFDGKKIVVDIDEYNRYYKKTFVIANVLIYGLIFSGLAIKLLVDNFKKKKDIELIGPDAMFKEAIVDKAKEALGDSLEANRIKEVNEKIKNEITNENSVHKKMFGFVFPIYYACKYDNIEVLKWLVDEKNVDISQCSLKLLNSFELLNEEYKYFTNIKNEYTEGYKVEGAISYPIVIALKNKSLEAFKFCANKYFEIKNKTEKDRIDLLVNHISLVESCDNIFIEGIKKITENYLQSYKADTDKIYFLEKMVNVKFIRSACKELVEYFLQKAKERNAYLVLALPDGQFNIDYKVKLSLVEIAYNNIIDEIKNKSTVDAEISRKVGLFLKDLATFALTNSKSDLFKKYLEMFKGVNKLNYQEINKSAIEYICGSQNFEFVKILLDYGLKLSIKELGNGLFNDNEFNKFINDFNLDGNQNENIEKIGIIMAIVYSKIKKYGKLDIKSIKNVFDKINESPDSEVYIQVIMNEAFNNQDFEVIKYLFRENEIVKNKRIRPAGDVIVNIDFKFESKILKFLLENGIYNINEALGTTQNNRKFIDIAIENTDLELIKYLIENGATIDQEKHKVFCSKYRWSYHKLDYELSIIKYFIDNGVKIDINYNYLNNSVNNHLKITVENARKNFVKLAIELKKFLEQVKVGQNIDINKNSILDALKREFDNNYVPLCYKQALLNDIIKYYYIRSTSNFIDKDFIEFLFGKIEFNYYFMHGDNLQHLEQLVQDEEIVAQAQNGNQQVVQHPVLEEGVIKNRHKNAIKFALEKCLKDCNNKSIIDAIIEHDDQQIYIPLVIEKKIAGKNSLDKCNKFVKDSKEKIMPQREVKKKMWRGLSNAGIIARDLTVTIEPLTDENYFGRRLERKGGLWVENGEKNAEGKECKVVKEIPCDMVAKIMGYAGTDFGPRVYHKNAS